MSFVLQGTMNGEIAIYGPFDHITEAREYANTVEQEICDAIDEDPSFLKYWDRRDPELSFDGYFGEYQVIELLTPIPREI